MRERLPNRRQHVSTPVRHRYPPADTTKPDLWFDMSYGWVGDGAERTIKEVFIHLDHPRNKNQDEANLFHDIATMVSIALQHGATLDELAGATGHADVQVMDRQERFPHSPIATILYALIEAQDELRKAPQDP